MKIIVKSHKRSGKIVKSHTRKTKRAEGSFNTSTARRIARGVLGKSNVRKVKTRRSPWIDVNTPDGVINLGISSKRGNKGNVQEFNYSKRLFGVG